MASSASRSAAGAKARNLEPSAAPSGSKSGAEGAAGAAGARPRRRVPSLLLGLGGAVVAVAYASLAEKMRFGPPLVMVGLGGMTLVLSAIALWRVIDPLARPEGAAGAAGAPRAPQRLRELEREKQLVLKAIKEIELDYQMRKIAEPDYKEMVERYRARAMRLISELEAGDNYRELIERELKDRLAALEARGQAEAAAAPSSNTAGAGVVEAPAAGGAGAAEKDAARPARGPATASAGCPGCGSTTNDQDAQFCKKCGAKLV